MRSHATIAALVGAAFLWAATAVAQVTPTTARVMKGTLTDSTVPSTNVPGPVAITYYLPKDYDAKRAEPYPLLIQLHGGGLSNKVMERDMGGLLDQAIENGLVAPMVSVMPSTRLGLDAFLAEVKKRKSSSRGRLVLAIDATASRQPTWDTACELQAEMFREAAAVGGLEIQLVYYRGLGECKASAWLSDGQQLARAMTRVSCVGGETQIARILSHARRETEKLKVAALVFVGDAMEGDNPDTLAHEAGELGRLSVPAFMFQEGCDEEVERTFREIARLTHGAYCRFDPGAARQLGGLLRAVAVFAAGGMTALAARKDAGAVKLLGQVKRG